MKVFKITDDYLGTEIGHILYYEKCRDFIIHLRENLDEWSAPLLLTKYVKDNIYIIPRDVSLLWVKERIVPTDRQNIGEILSNARMKSYDEFKLLELSHGKCSQDSIHVELIDNIPGYIEAREEQNITECLTLNDRNMLCFFKNSSTKRIDLNKLDHDNELNKVLRNNTLFQSAEVGTGGYFLTFDNSIDIPASLIYEVGTNIPLTLEDFTNFARNTLDTGETTDLLECSRQNISYMVSQNRLIPVKDKVRGSLYLKGDVVRNNW